MNNNLSSCTIVTFEPLEQISEELSFFLTARKYSRKSLNLPLRTGTATMLTKAAVSGQQESPSNLTKTSISLVWATAGTMSLI